MERTASGPRTGWSRDGSQWPAPGVLGADARWRPVYCFDGTGSPLSRGKDVRLKGNYQIVTWL